MLPYLLKHLFALDATTLLWIQILGASLTSSLLMFVLCPLFIQKMRGLQASQPIRQGMILSHEHKSNTPTMGGVMILFSMLVSLCLWAEWQSMAFFGVVFSLVAFGAIGALDDSLKIKFDHSDGLSARWKYALQSLTALIVIACCFDGAHHSLVLPFAQLPIENIGFWFFPLAYFVIVGASNSVNLTDGLDGLAIMPSVLVGLGLGVVAFLSVSHASAHYYLLFPLHYGSDLVVFCAVLVGSGLGFLWFNAFPAKIFMGDVGALAIGGALGTIAVCMHQEVLLFMMGGVFVAETVSVILQVGSFKLTGNRIFKMAPLHHHFELKGWGEAQIVLRFWLATFLLVVASLILLRLRILF